VYERALLNELRLRGAPVEPQVPIPVFYKGEQVGEYFADLVVGGALLVEVKCADEFCREHTAQCLNYLRANGYRIALLINFQQPRVSGNESSTTSEGSPPNHFAIIRVHSRSFAAPGLPAPGTRRVPAIALAKQVVGGRALRLIVATRPSRRPSGP
jgi:GxxExxY protein